MQGVLLLYKKLPKYPRVCKLAFDWLCRRNQGQGKGKENGVQTMAWLECFYPDEYLDSAYEIDYEGLYRQGYRGVIFDIDNTLVPHGAPADVRSIALFEKLQSIGLESMLLSNNKEPRVKMFNDKVHSHYIYKAGKPSTRSYQKAMERMGTDASTTFFVGDQLFTDVWGAKKAGIRTFLVKPIHPKEEIQIVLKRRLEWIVLFFYKRSKGKYSDLR